MAKQRIAVVSTDDMNVNDHFGRAETFLIYDLGETMSFVEKRSTEKLSVGDRSHSFDPEKFNRLYEKIMDCSQVYVVRIGEKPAEKLKEQGIEPVIYEGPIEGIARKHND